MKLGRQKSWSWHTWVSDVFALSWCRLDGFNTLGSLSAPGLYDSARAALRSAFTGCIMLTAVWAAEPVSAMTGSLCSLASQHFPIKACMGRKDYPAIRPIFKSQINSALTAFRFHLVFCLLSRNVSSLLFLPGHWETVGKMLQNILIGSNFFQTPTKYR